MKNKKIKIILASGSQRRIELLKMAGCKFETVQSKAKEKIDNNLSPAQNAKKLSCLKAANVAIIFSDGIIIGADTIVAVSGKILGKPKDKNEARKMISLLSGKEHEAITGIALIDAKTKKIIQDVVTTKVKFQKLSKTEIENYLNCGENLFDKAGAYAIQGKASLFTEWIKGDYYNIMGLPLNRLYKLLQKFGVNLLSN